MPEIEAGPEALPTAMRPPHRARRWPLFLIAAPAAVAVWSGWVGLVQPLPGIVAWHLNTAITLPVGVESYGAYALGAWLTPGTSEEARTFARRSAIGSLTLGVLGQVAYHLLAAGHTTRAPWLVVVFVSCLPVVTLGFGAALTHLLRIPVGSLVEMLCDAGVAGVVRPSCGHCGRTVRIDKPLDGVRPAGGATRGPAPSRADAAEPSAIPSPGTARAGRSARTA